MNRTNRTIEEKLAIVQQLKNNSAASKTMLKTNQKDISPKEKNLCMVYIVIRLVICILLFGAIVFIGSQSPAVGKFVGAMITTEENGNLIDFMSPFTYTLQENVESAPGADAETQESESPDTSVPSEE